MSRRSNSRLLPDFISRMDNLLQKTYDSSHEKAEAVYKEYNSSVKSGHVQSIVKSDEVNWERHGKVSWDYQDMINAIVQSGQKTFYGIAIVSLAEKIIDPSQDILVYSDDPDIIGERLAYDGYPLNKIGRDIINPFLSRNDFLEARAGDNVAFLPDKFSYRKLNMKWGPDFSSKAVPRPAFKALMLLLEAVQKGEVSPRECMKAFFTRSIYRRMEVENSKVTIRDDIGINRSKAFGIVKEHIDADYDSIKNKSALPVLAVWSACKCQIEGENSDAILEMYHSHHATDSPASPGDIIVKNKNGFMDAIDVKGHEKKLTFKYVQSAFNKKIRESAESHSLRNYYYVYCDEPDAIERRKIETLSDEAFERHECNILLVSLDDLLRRGLPRDCSDFMKTYNHEVDKNRYKELQPEHIEKLGEILEREEISLGKEENKANSREDVAENLNDFFGSKGAAKKDIDDDFALSR